MKVVAIVLMMASCKRSDHQAEGKESTPERLMSRQFSSLSGSWTDLRITLKSDQGNGPDDKSFEITIYSDVSKHTRFAGPAYLDQYWMGLYQFEGETVGLKCNGDHIYIREGMPLREAYQKGWCVAEQADEGFLHPESITRFFKSIEDEAK